MKHLCEGKKRNFVFNINSIISVRLNREFLDFFLQQKSTSLFVLQFVEFISLVSSRTFWRPSGSLYC